MRRWALPETASLPRSRMACVDLTITLCGLLMFISGWTQREHPEPYPPEVQTVRPRELGCGSPVAFIQVMADGAVVVNREVLFDHESPEGSRLAEYFEQKATRMRKRPHGPEGVRLPDDPILIRADRTVPFEDVERVLHAARDVGIWRIQFGVVQAR